MSVWYRSSVRAGNPVEGTRKFLVFPEGNMRAASPMVQEAMATLTPNSDVASVVEGAPAATVLGQTHEHGIKLVRAGASQMQALRDALPNSHTYPEVFHRRQRAPFYRVDEQLTAAAGAHQDPGQIQVTVQSAEGTPVAGANVIAFTDFANRLGAQAVSDAQGNATITLSPLPHQIERIYVYVDADYWSGLFFNLDTSHNIEVRLHSIDLSVPDILNGLYTPKPDDGKGAVIGIVDAGVDFGHPDLAAAKKVDMNMVTGVPTDDGSPGAHATHVAGIIGGRGFAPDRKLGIAPAAELCSYRVFPSGDETGASNFAIVSAIEQAVADGCQLINMSLGGGPEDPATEKAIDFAWQNGVVCIVANGNGGRQPVSSPASYSPCVGISAFGRPGACPPDTVSVASVAPPFDTSGKFEIADFSNIGPQTDLTGGGVGVISTVLNAKYGVMDGTSMACPAVTGRAAVILAQQGTLAKPPDANRSTEIRQVLESTARSMGFGANYEGHGALP